MTQSFSAAFCSLMAGVTLLSLCIAGCDDNPPATDSQTPTSQRDVSDRRPSIIVLIADDLAGGLLGFEGNAHIRTPHLDKMASEGTRFRYGYVAIPQCAPNRASLVTGKFPSEHGVTSNRVREEGVPGPLIGEVMRDAGYRCGFIGKWHLGPADHPTGGFENYWVSMDREETERGDKMTNPTMYVNGEHKTYDRYLTDLVTDYAIEFTDVGPTEQPYFLWVSFYAPHTPLTPNPAFPYDPDAIPDPPSVADDLSAKPAAQRGTAHERFLKTPEQRRRRQRAAYYSMISTLDANIGRLLDHLRDTGQADNTIVLFSSDNGYLFGEHQMLSKDAALYEPLTNMPFVWWGPGRVPAGRVIDAPASMIDLFPTFTALGGGRSVTAFEGVSLWPVIAGELKLDRDAVYLEYYEKAAMDFDTGEVQHVDREPILGVVSGVYKYTRYLMDGAEELYDLGADPDELKNLAADPAMQTQLTRLRKLADDRLAARPALLEAAKAP